MQNSQWQAFSLRSECAFGQFKEVFVSSLYKDAPDLQINVTAINGREIGDSSASRRQRLQKKICEKLEPGQ
jgi:hypothetical protein